MTVKLPSFEHTKILVVGDIMVDRYLFGLADRISPEAPVPVVHISKQEDKPGGAGNVALNLKALGAKVSLAGLCGYDEEGNKLIQSLEQLGIECFFHFVSNFPTIIKQRVLSQQHQLIRLDFEEHYPKSESDALVTKIKTLIPEFDIILLSDYGKGSLHSCQDIIQTAKNFLALFLLILKEIIFQNTKAQHCLHQIEKNLKQFKEQSSIMRI